LKINQSVMARKQQHLVTVSVLILFMVFNRTSLAENKAADLSGSDIIPKPVSVTATGGMFRLKSGTKIYVSGGTDELLKIGKYLSDRLRPATGYSLDVISTEKVPGPGNIYITLNNRGSNGGNEGYELEINRKMVILSAATPAGLFRGVQTIRQVLPAKAEMASKQKGAWEIPTGKIIDYPEYSYRGIMIDVARHFFGPEHIKHIIDLIAYYKMNVLHLHLSDDQGWRIEIKSWPGLTGHGGTTQVGGGKGGYFTQQEYSELVRYAKDQYITIIPEIDMPGHTNAALASYAELNCSGKATELYTGTRVGFSTLCTDKEITYKFVSDVVRELAGLTPGEYIHIGGDESHATKKEDYILFINKVQDIVSSAGKKVIGWDEIALSSLKSGSVAQTWANISNSKKAVGQGAKIIMSPAKKAYLDMKYDRSTTLGLNWAGYIEIDSAYIWDPATLVPGIGKEKILGVEAPLWTETITNMKDMEFMIFPRLPGYAEIGWTSGQHRSWNDYKKRLGNHGERFNAMGINYYRSALVPWAGQTK
jgi:hexosaminidase